MADSIRKDILDAAEVDLLTITGIRRVATSILAHTELGGDFPAVAVVDGDTTIERLAYGAQMEAKMELVVWCYEHDAENVLAAKRTNLIRDVIVKLTAGTLAGLAHVLDVVETAIRTDQGGLPNYAIARVVFTVTYTYAQGVP